MKLKKIGLIAITIVGLLVSFVVVIFLAPLASSSPDGLEKVGEIHGFAHKASLFLKGLIPDYIMPGLGNESVATIFAGIIGVLIVFAATYLLALLLKRKRKPRNPNS